MCLKTEEYHGSCWKMNLKKNLKYKDVIIEVDVTHAGDTNSYGSDWKEIMLYVWRRHPSSTFQGRNSKRCSVRQQYTYPWTYVLMWDLKHIFYDVNVMSLKHKVSFCFRDRIPSNMEVQQQQQINNNNIIINIPSMVNEKTILPQISQFSTHLVAFSSLLKFFVLPP